jgi:hypothetical protein
MNQPPKPFAGIIRPHGGYQDLKSYQTAEIVYDATVVFCDRLACTSGRMLRAWILALKKENFATRT